MSFEHIKVISFDHDNTLANEDFDKIIWNEEIPALIAARDTISLEKAKDYVYSEYYKAAYIEEIDTWTDIDYWFNRFGLTNWKELMAKRSHHVEVFEDTISTLEYLKKKYTLVMSSFSHPHFIEFKIGAEGIAHYFENIYTPTGLGCSGKNSDFYEKIVSLLGVQAEEVLHIGDSKERDVEAPTRIGVSALWFRKGAEDNIEKGIIGSLRSLKKIL